MKSYPIIDRESCIGRLCHTFEKKDGSNIRIAFSNKKGWYLFGSRNELIDEKHPFLGQAIPIFMNNLADEVERKFNQNRWKAGVVFCEFWGENSFAGSHLPEDEKYMSLFDVNVDSIGLISPEIFLDNFLDLPYTPSYLGKITWDRNYIKDVRSGLYINEHGLEGVIGKVWDNRKKKVIMSKAKTQSWIDKVFATYDKQTAEKLL